MRAAWLGVVGSDAFGSRIVRELSAEGVDVGAVRYAEAPTGFMLRGLRHAELSTVAYYRSGSAGSLLEAADVENAMTAYTPRMVHLTGITPALSRSAAEACRRGAELARSVGAELSLDVNLRRTLPGFRRGVEVTRELLPGVDVLFVGEDELDAVGDTADPGRALEDLLSLGVGEVVVKLGSAGAMAGTGSGTHRVAAQPIPARDVIGAGDSFVAGYLAARVDGLPVSDRLRWGNVVAGFTVASPSDWRDLPTRAELDAELAAGPRTTR